MVDSYNDCWPVVTVSALNEVSSTALTAPISRNASKTKTKALLKFIFYIMFLMFKNIIVKKISN